MKNNLENIFQYLVMSRKMSFKNNLLIFFLCILKE